MAGPRNPKRKPTTQQKRADAIEARRRERRRLRFWFANRPSGY